MILNCPPTRRSVRASTSISRLCRRWDNRPPVEIERDICRVLYQHGIRGYGTLGTYGVSANGVDAKLVDGKVVCDFTQLDSSIGWALSRTGLQHLLSWPLFWRWHGRGGVDTAQMAGHGAAVRRFQPPVPGLPSPGGGASQGQGLVRQGVPVPVGRAAPRLLRQGRGPAEAGLAGRPRVQDVGDHQPNSIEAFWGVVKAWSSCSRGLISRGDEWKPAAGPATKSGFTTFPPAWRARPGTPPVVLAGRDYGAKGAQLWSVNFYNGIDPWQEITSKPGYEAGEAIMVYPNPKGGLPLSSLRFRLLQKGIDDFEYLAILQQRLEATCAPPVRRTPPPKPRPA